jgi:hypothetical protein
MIGQITWCGGQGATKLANRRLLDVPLLNFSHNLIKVVPPYQANAGRGKSKPCKQQLAKAESYDRPYS